MKQLISAALILLFSFLTVNNVNLQQVNPNSINSIYSISAKYFPLQVGNTWVYYVSTFPPLENPILDDLTQINIL